MSLMCDVDSCLCALPLEHVVETMRPLPIEVLAATPRFIRGMSVIRGEMVPVVDAALLVGAAESHPTRLVTLAVADRRVALAVDAVVGVRVIGDEMLRELPPLLRDLSTAMVSTIGVLDAALLIVLNSARLVPEAMWAALDDAVPSS
jgi:purine-binding chemotaxis protein CheW